MPRKLKEFELVRKWAKERGLYDFGDVKTQTLKMQEELGELSRAILKQNKPDMIDAIGDMQVVLINLAELAGVPLEDCLNIAYNVIKNRKGSMSGGTFVKEIIDDDALSHAREKEMQEDNECTECAGPLNVSRQCVNPECEFYHK